MVGTFNIYRKRVRWDRQADRQGISRFRRGLSLIAVLWIVTILTVLASEFIYSMQLEVRVSRNWHDQVNALYAAKGGFETALAFLRNDETSYDSLDEDWAKRFSGELNNSIFETKIIDESSKINVNTADEETLRKLIEYCMSSASKETSEAEISSSAQTLASAIIENRPYRTVAEMAKVDGMTPELLYGYYRTSETSGSTRNEQDEEGQNIVALVDVATVYSLDKNISSDGRRRVNINTADSNQIRQGVNPQGQEVITQQEAQAIVDYRGQLGSGQQPGGGGSGQGGQPNQSGYRSVAQLLDVPAISQQTFDSIRDRITVEDQGGEQQQGENQPRKININTASADELRSLSDRIDNGIAESITRYRQNNRFDNIEEIMQVKAVSIDDMKVIVDKVTTSDDQTLPGRVNINTAPLEILRILPGLDEEKAKAIIAYREAGTDQGTTTGTSSSQQGGPFDNHGKLLDVQGIDENTFRSIIDNVTYRSYAFRIESEGRSSDKKVVQACTAVVDRSGNSIKIRYWKQ